MSVYTAQLLCLMKSLLEFNSLPSPQVYRLHSSKIYTLNKMQNFIHNGEEKLYRKMYNFTAK